ncbi:hypothetical protein GGG16DRAFT_99343 [Schizophyllum commune]
MASHSTLVLAVSVVCACGVSAAEQNSSDQHGLSHGAAAGILIALACAMLLSLISLERRRKRRTRALNAGSPSAPLPSRRSSRECRNAMINQPWRISPSSRRDGDPVLLVPMEIVAPPPTYDAALKDKQPPHYKVKVNAVIQFWRLTSVRPTMIRNMYPSILLYPSIPSSPQKGKADRPSGSQARHLPTPAAQTVNYLQPFHAAFAHISSA